MSEAKPVTGIRQVRQRVFSFGTTHDLDTLQMRIDGEWVDVPTEITESEASKKARSAWIDDLVKQNKRLDEIMTRPEPLRRSLFSWFRL